ncbi:hypothetical protein VTO42DRAFT_7428 [Malbranchea cinnamomea]
MSEVNLLTDCSFTDISCGCSEIRKECVHKTNPEAGEVAHLDPNGPKSSLSEPSPLETIPDQLLCSGHIIYIPTFTLYYAHSTANYFMYSSLPLKLHFPWSHSIWCHPRPVFLCPEGVHDLGALSVRCYGLSIERMLQQPRGIFFSNHFLHPKSLLVKFEVDLRLKRMARLASLGNLWG